MKSCFEYMISLLLGLRLYIFLFQGFYKKIAYSEFQVDEDLKKERCSPWQDQEVVWTKTTLCCKDVLDILSPD